MKLNQLNRIKLIIFFILMAGGACILPISVYGESAPLASLYPQTSGRSVILMDLESGRVLYEQNSRQELPPASVTKIMTALLVIENGNLEKEVTISEHAADTPESTVYLEPGEKLTRKDLLYACMLPSANDACVALAESVAGSEESFIQLMNARAQQLGMGNTHYCNPHGLDAEQHYTTAYDLAILSRYSLQNSIFAELVNTQKQIIPWEGRDEDRILLNQNRLLYRYEGACGVKTGFTRQAGNCVVGAAKRGKMGLIAISLNSPAVYEDLMNMLDYGFNNYRLIELAEVDELSSEIKVLGGVTETVKAVPEKNLQVAATDDEASQLTYKVQVVSEVSAPVKQGDILGVCKIYKQDEQVGVLNLLADKPVYSKQSMAQSLGVSLDQYYGVLLILLLLILSVFNKKIAKIYKSILRLAVLVIIYIIKFTKGIFSRGLQKRKSTKNRQQIR